MLHLRAHTDKPLFVDQLCCLCINQAEKFLSFMKHLEETAPSVYLRLVDHDYPTLEAKRVSVASSSPESKPLPAHLLEGRDMLREMVIKMRNDEIFLRGFVDVCSRHYLNERFLSY